MGLDMYLQSNKRGEVMYWRKANHIHGWFERKLNGIDNQRQHAITYDALEDLLMDCIRVKDSLIAGGTIMKDTVIEKGIKNGEPYQKVEPRPHFKNTVVALELLPPTQGFFFGSDNIDEYYLQDIEETIEKLSTVLSTKEKGERFYYYAWW
jgi:hypothetical protein